MTSNQAIECAPPRSKSQHPLYPPIVMMRASLFIILVSLVSLVGCLTKSTQNNQTSSRSKEITRERAIEIARPQVKFQPKSITAEKATDNGRAVWRVTFRGEPVTQVHPMAEIMIVNVDRQS